MRHASVSFRCKPASIDMNCPDIRSQRISKAENRVTSRLSSRQSKAMRAVNATIPGQATNKAGIAESRKNPHNSRLQFGLSSPSATPQCTRREKERSQPWNSAPLFLVTDCHRLGDGTAHLLPSRPRSRPGRGYCLCTPPIFENPRRSQSSLSQSAFNLGARAV